MSDLPGPRSEYVDGYLRRIVATMVELFAISEDEAVGRVRRRYGHWDLTSEDAELHFGHEDARYWAHHVYYGPDVAWWREPPENLTPLPWP